MLILSIGTVVYWIAVPLFDTYYSTNEQYQSHQRQYGVPQEVEDPV